MAIQEKDQSIETLRGVAIILMVIGHVIGNDAAHGLKVDDDSFYRYFYFTFQFFRLPLFTVISGFVYAIRPVQEGKVIKFLQGKGRRILYPLVSVATLEFLMRCYMPGVNEPRQLSEIWTIYFFPFDHFWFLQAIFLVFLAVTLLDRLGMMKRVWMWAACWAGAIALGVFAPKHAFFSVNNFLYLLPYFMLGVGLNRFQAHLRRPEVLLAALFIFAAGITYQQKSWYEGFKIDHSKFSLLAYCVGLTGNLLLFRARWMTTWLAWLGFYSYSIYLFHVFGTGGSRIIISKVGLTNQHVLFVISLTCGLLLPIIAETILLRSKVLRRVFLGLR